MQTASKFNNENATKIMTPTKKQAENQNLGAWGTGGVVDFLYKKKLCEQY